MGHSKNIGDSPSGVIYRVSKLTFVDIKINKYYVYLDLFFALQVRNTKL